MSVFPVSPSANRVSGIYTRPYLVRNSGQETVYLGQDSSLSPTARAITLTVGGTLNWSGDTELWACTDAGLLSEIEILYTGDSSFTPGPTTVGTRNTLDQLERKLTQPLPNTTAVLLLADVSAYSSLNLHLQVSGNFNSNVMRVVVQWGLGGFETYYMSVTGEVSISLSVKSTSVSIVLINGSGFFTGTYSYSITGSSIQIPAYYQHKYSQFGLLPYTSFFGVSLEGDITNELIAFQGTLPAAGVGQGGTWSFPSIAAELILTVIWTGAGSARLRIGAYSLVGGTTRYLYYGETLSGFIDRQRINLPRGPVFLECIDNGGGGGTLFANLNMV